ncbi:ComEC/Rec2 family competence protein [Lutimonas halocynthiae]|nr:ComEC/Rec2 family competence protein [Lutimonas halocynthiae]MDN3641487.1 ComEC/Rec2 family competence protein [Lutimonas halocynthiae]
MLLFSALIIAYLTENKSFNPPYLFVILSFLLMTFLGITISTRSKPHHIRAHFSNHYVQGSLLEVKILEKLKNNDFYMSYLGEIIGVNRLRSEGKIMIRVANKDSLKPLQLDEVLVTAQKLLRFKEPLNPGEFNFKEYARRKGLFYQLTLDNGEFFVAKDEQMGIRSKALMLREQMLRSLVKQDFSPEEFMIIEALLLGRKNDLAKEITEKYKNAGAMHILAISGLHIGILLMILNIILKPIEKIKHGKKAKLFLLLLFLWFFALLSGLSPSVVRSVLMFSILSIGIVTGRSSNLNHYLFVSLFLTLLIEPLFIFDLGFQLSYVALISIIGIGPIIKNLWTPKHKLLRYFWALFVVSLAAQLGILPLSLYYFHHFSGAFMLSSLIVIPILGLVLGGGYMMIFLDQINYLPKMYVGIYSYLIESMNRVIDLIGNIEILIYSGIYFNLFLVILCYILIYYIVKFIKLRSIEQLIKLCFCCMVIFSFLLFEYKMGQSKSNFMVFNKYKESLFFKRSGNDLTIYASPENGTVHFEKKIEDYSTQHLNLTLNHAEGIKHFYKFQNKHIMVIDHESIKTDFGFEPDILVLIKSPKINLNRLLMKIHPSVIIADGSNYQTYKSLWKKSAKAAGVIFHDTSKDGAFILSEES